MPVLIRERINSDNDTQESHYKTARGVITTEDKKLARRNDEEIERRFRKIEREFAANGLLDLKKSHGVIKLWWEVGKRLQFLDRLDVGDERDRIWLWRACYDHAGKLNPSRNGTLSVRARERPKNSHFRYATLLGRLNRRTMQAIGIWDSWSGICDSECFQNDDRFVEWLKDRAHQPGSTVARIVGAKKHQDLFRELAKRIRHRFKKMDTSVLETNELFSALDSVAAEVIDAEATFSSTA
jgi:hypothetical protein